MSHFATAYLPLPKSAAHIRHTILQPHDIQIMFSKFGVLVNAAVKRPKDVDSSPPGF